MKKIVSIISAVILVIGLISGCGTTTPPDTSSFIGEERAKEIALEKAGVTADGAVFDRVELDMDNGQWQYEVEFRKDNIEYNADIKADDGTVLKWETDRD